MKHYLIFITIIATCVLTLFSYSTSLRATNITQCMIDCIKQEGKAAKATCKFRCANILLPLANAKTQPSCMSIFKKCKNTCNKSDKACWQNCKQRLMKCE